MVSRRARSRPRIRAGPKDPTPRALAALVVSIERMLLDLAREHLVRGDEGAKAKRSLVRACDRAFELLERGTSGVK